MYEIWSIWPDVWSEGLHIIYFNTIHPPVMKSVTAPQLDNIVATPAKHPILCRYSSIETPILVN